MRGGGRMIKRLWILLLLFCGIFIGGVLLFRHQYHAVMTALAQTQVKNVTSDLINDAIDSQIRSGIVRYDRMVYFEKDLNGRITALKTNMSEVNRLKTELLNIINDEILTIDSDQLGIPLGSLILPEIFAGIGPLVPVHIMAIRNSDASFFSEFSEAGINQTMQKLNMQVCIDVAVLILGSVEEFTISSQVVVAETVIVGQVPDMFLQTGGIYELQRENG
jgi:sporulation protein YunB